MVYDGILYIAVYRKKLENIVAVKLKNKNRIVRLKELLRS
jgi:hypothetical protein